jgi:C4-dicarboxylate-specific signal transduction histidine kinase
MKILLALNFLIFATIQLGLLFGILHYLRSESSAKPNPYWIGALIINILGLGFFAIGILLTDEIQKVPPIFTVANALFYAGAILQGLFFYSFNHQVNKSLKWALGLSMLCYGVFFEFLRQHWTFEARTLFAVSTYAIILAWQIREARIVNRSLGLQQLRYFQYAAIGEGLFLVPRLLVLWGANHPINAIEQLPQLLIIFTFGQILMNTLSFIAIWGYWSEKLAIDSRQTESEKNLYKKLLEERETLISSLLKVNKTSTTGALSASIAHEINQPLGAIQINSEYLQKKVQEEEVDRQLIVRLAEDIARDNMRAARIIQTLKLIFSEKYDAFPEKVFAAEVLESVALLTKSDLFEKHVQLKIDMPKSICLPMSIGEAQQIFLNLINNAAQATEHNSQSDRIICISGREGSDQMVIRCEDNGPGVSKDRVAHLFDLFSGSKREGMGLGLWLCEYIITRHGGKIQFDTQYFQGAAFEISFPKTE